VDFIIGNNNASNMTFTGSILNTAGVLSLVKTGSGLQTIAPGSSYSGSTTVGAGTLAVSAPSLGMLVYLPLKVGPASPPAPRFQTPARVAAR